MTIEFWPSNAYPSVQLSPEQQVDCKRIGLGLVQEVIRDYKEYDKMVPRMLDRVHWKPVKRRGKITIYKERISSKDSCRDSESSSNSEWQAPKLLVGTGTIDGSLDDIMFGIMSPDSASLQQQSAYAKMNAVDGQTLAVIEAPTPDQPYRSMTLQWMVNTPGPGLQTIVKARDMVLVAATGIIKLEDGTKAGYYVAHSVDLWETPPRKNMVRARLSSCIIFKQVEGNTVDVYVKGYYEAFGKVLDSIAEKVTAGGLLMCSSSVDCANHRKLSWILQSQSLLNEYADRQSAVNANDRSSSVCMMCMKRFAPFRKRYSCLLCGVVTCSSCTLAKVSIDILPVLRMKRSKVRMCDRCSIRITQESSYKCARQQILAGRYDSLGQGSTFVSRNRLYSDEADNLLSREQQTCDGEELNIHSLSDLSSDSTPMGSYINLCTPTGVASSVESHSYMEQSASGRSADDEWDELVQEANHLDWAEVDANAIENEAKRQKAWAKMTSRRLQMSTPESRAWVAGQ